MKTPLLGLYNPDLTRPYGVVVLNEWKANLIPALRAVNPNVKVLLYKNAAFLREDDNASTVGGFKTAPESWFLHDANGDRITRLVYGVRAHMMDPLNAAWRAHWAIEALDAAEAIGSDGVFADDVFSKKYGEVSAAVGCTDLAYQTAVRGFLAAVKAWMPNHLLVANLVEHMTYPNLWADWLTVCDGLMDEHFQSASVTGGLADDRGDNWWLQRVQQVEECERQGKLGLFRSKGGAIALARMNYCWASFLLGAGPHTHWTHTEATDNTSPWFDGWGHDFGEPLGPRVLVGNVWARGFKGGEASVDPRQGVTTSSVSMWPATPPPPPPPPPPPIDPRLALLEAEHAAVMAPYRRVSGRTYKQVDAGWLTGVIAAGKAVEG